MKHSPKKVLLIIGVIVLALAAAAVVCFYLLPYNEEALPVAVDIGDPDLHRALRPTLASASAVPGPLCKLRWDAELNTASDGSGKAKSLTSGTHFYLLEAFAADGLRHKVAWGGSEWYVPTAALDLGEASGLTGYVFNGEQDMRTQTGFSGEQIEKCLSYGLSGLGESFAAAERTYGVNALFMVAICQHESGNGTSGLATSQNNLIGLRSGSGWASFGSKAECVDHLGNYLSTYYLDPGDPYYHGSTIASVSVTYCNGSGEWVTHIKNYMSSDLAKITAE